jgi:CubicO group peptidase (beta-lactamase class C family)
MIKMLMFLLATSINGYSPGCALGVLHDGAVVYQGARGYADLDYGVPLTTNSVFYIASDSKQFTAFCIALLVDRGIVRLSDPVAKWIPELPATVYGSVTIADLIHHTSGVRDYWGLLDLQGISSTLPVSQADFLSLIAAQKALNFRPGERFEYSNSGYALLGLVVASASGKSLPQFAHDEIFVPLGMRHTSYGADHLLPLPNRAVGYDADDGRYRIDPSALEPLGDGGVHTTVGDMLLWLMNLEHNRLGERPDNVAALARAPGRLNDGGEVAYAFGLAIGSRHGYVMFDHTGEYGGYESFVAWLPQLRLGVVTLCNSQNAPLSAGWIGLNALDRYAAPGTTPSPVLKAPIAAVKLSAEETAKVLGTYIEPDGTVWRLTLNRDGVEAHVQGLTFALKPLDATRLQAVGAPQQLEIEMEDSGLWLTVGHGPKEALKRLTPPALTPAMIAEYSGTYFSGELNLAFRVYGNSGKLFIARDLAPVQTLEPAQPDVFTMGPRNMAFERNARGAIDGIVLSASGVDALAIPKLRAYH